MWPFRRKPSTAVKAAVANIERLRYTPDVTFLETVHPWFVFIYDDLQKGHPRHHKLANTGATLPNPERPRDPLYATTNADFCVWKHRDGQNSFAVALDMPPARFKNVPAWDMVSPRACKVKGQLFKTDWRGIAMLDEYYRNTVEFRRRAVSVTQTYHFEMEMPDGTVSISLPKQGNIHAWMYVGIQEVWDNILDGSFTPVRVFNKNGAHYVPIFSFFTNIEYVDK